ncbi:hypothetical protein [Streptomyces iconiensis]|uniref:Uncharacterized protein n=1 Tax=Streptomyces iconiensis TaxID=1384038 RepID=A0ABT6ZUF2_9ACTN|nr:hypothetical protein [Streptomyces iconiensis]MDJ1132444.1 hypothetical protein [Streptomyces iconiensis]
MTALLWALTIWTAAALAAAPLWTRTQHRRRQAQQALHDADVHASMPELLDEIHRLQVPRADDGSPR